MEDNKIGAKIYNREDILRAVKNGTTYRVITEIYGCRKSTISYLVTRYGKTNRVKYDWEEIQKFYDAGHTVKECSTRFGFTKGAWEKAAKTNRVVRDTLRTHIRKSRSLESLVFEANPLRRTIVRKLIIREQLLPYLCSRCSISTWQSEDLALHLDHVDGDNANHRIENLRWLCPNCHSLTLTYKGRNIKRKRLKTNKMT